MWGAQLIDWVSNESVGFQKQESDPCFIVQTTPDILLRHVQTGSFSGLSHELLLRSSKFLLSVLGGGFTCNNASKKKNGFIFYACIKVKLSTYGK